MTILLIGNALVSGCATSSEVARASDEVLCWGNISAKSNEEEGNFKEGKNIMRSPLWPLGLGFMFFNRVFNTVAATTNPDCYFKDKNSEEETLEKTPEKKPAPTGKN